MLKRNITANYISQIYVTGIGILILPFYIKYMGAEAYGLVGFFAMLQACFAMLDLGLTPTIARETARYNAGMMTAISYRRLLRALNLIFFGVSLVSGVCLLLLSDLIVAKWLTTENLSKGETLLAVQIMAISVSLRFLCGLYRGVVTGYEKLVLLSVFNSGFATLRFIGVFISMWCFGFSATVFFTHQLVVALLELIGLWVITNRLKPELPELAFIGWSFQPVRPILKFSLAIAFTSSVWVLVTQTDKLILSGILSLTEYGYYTLAVLTASGIMVISGPISNALMPRLAKLHAEGNHDELVRVYRISTQLVSVVAGSAAVVIAFYAEQLLFAWTGDIELAASTGPILRLYVIGNGFLVISAFPYYLQYALGNLKYHLIGNAIMVILLVPAIVIVALHYGAVGAGYVWALINGFYLVVWVAYVHYRLEPGLHVKWLAKDVLTIYVSVFIFVYIISFFSLETENRALGGFYIIMISIAALLVAIGSASFLRQRFFQKMLRVN